MRSHITYPEHFSKSTPKSAEDIKRACQTLESSRNPEYIVKHNGNHIWLEVGEEQQEVWSPLLHLELRSTEDKTVVKGQFVENPGLWVTLLILRMIVLTAFIASMVFLYFQISQGEPAGKGLLFMFASISMWFGLALLAQWNRRVSYKQAERLRALMENIVA